MNPAPIHPNATAAAVGGAVAVLVMYGLTFAGVTITPATEGAIATVVSTFLLLLPGGKSGRRLTKHK